MRPVAVSTCFLIAFLFVVKKIVPFWCMCVFEVTLQTHFKIILKDFDVLELHTWVEESHWNMFLPCSVLFDHTSRLGQMSEQSSPRLIWGHVYLTTRRTSRCCWAQTFFTVALYEGEVTKRQKPNRQTLIKASGWTGKAGLAPARRSRVHLCFRLHSSDFFVRISSLLSFLHIIFMS